MKSLKMSFALAAFAVASLSAASHYSLQLDSAQWAGDKELKPGTYSVQVVGEKAVFSSGKTVVEVPATVQTNDKKYAHTSFAARDSKITEIDLGGTNTKLVFGAAAAGTASGK